MKIPINETRKFLNGKLDNGVKYVVVEDDKIDISSVSVSVRVGSLSDPKEYQGLAHFLEHMLFMGSEKYPKENYFEQKIKSNGGTSNAYTDTFETVYYFSVNSNLDELVDIFSRFFIDPKFDQDSVNREINAIHSEHSKNINSNVWRIRQVIYNISKKDSIINSFSTGNLDTLNKKGVRDKMIEFYYNYYCSENISISIISPMKVKKLQEIVIKYFSLVQKKKCPELVLNKPFYNVVKQAYQIIPSGLADTFIYIWEIPQLINSFQETHIWQSISEVISSDVVGGLQSFLINQGLIRGLNSFVFEEGMFVLSIELIASNYDTYVNVNQYVKYFLKSIHKLNWNEIIKGQQKRLKILFDYGNRMDSLDLVEMLSLNLHYYPIDKTYSGSILIERNDSEQLLKQLKYLDVNKSIQLFVNNNKKSNYITDKYYGTKYTSSKWIDSPSKRFNINIDLDNPYYKIKPKMYLKLDKYRVPRIIKGNNRLWYGATSDFKESGIFAYLMFSSDKYYDTVEKNLLTTLSCNILNFLIDREFDKAIKLGFNTEFICSESLSTVNIYFHGLNDMFNYYMNEVLNYIQKIELDENVVRIHIEQMRKNLINIDKLTPWKYVNIILSDEINKYSYPSNILLKKLDYITTTKILKHIRVLFKIGGLTSFFYGNIPSDKIPDLKQFQSNYKLDITPIPNISLPISKKYNHPNPKEKNNLVQYMYPLGIFSPEQNIKKLMLDLIIDEPFYNELRTKAQLGYLVSTYSTRYGEYYYLIQKIQSEKKCSEICDKIDQFNLKFLRDLEKMDNSTWNKWKDTARNYLLEKEKNTKELFNKHIAEIRYRKYLFNRNELLLNKLTQVKLKDIVNYFYKKIINTNKIIIQIKSQIN